MTTATARTPIAAEGAPAPSRRSAVLAWALFALWAGLAVGAVALGWSNRSLNYVGPDGKRYFDVDLGFLAFLTFITFVYATVGAVVVARTRHVIGWLLLTIGIAYTFGELSTQYALHELVAVPGSLPATRAAAWVSNWIYGLAATSITLILLLFPTGAVRSHRWRPALVATPLAAGLWLISWALRPGPLNGPWNDHQVSVPNPLGLASLGGPFKVTFGIGVAASLFLSAAGVVALVLRFRGSRGVERQQVKWLAYVGVAAGVFLAGGMGLSPILGYESTASNALWTMFFTTLMLGIPVSIGAAILRYRLYDIDRIISRTVSYAIVTALLAGLYAVVAVVVPSAFLGTGDTPDGVIAGATLLVAAVFVPVRRRVQNAVDRRFNRSRYDAARTIEGFTARLRDEIDIDALGAELRQVIHRAMQPSHVDLWLAKR